jgi:hypothetical protein
MDSATESIYLGDPGVDRHHRIIHTLSFPALGLTHPCGDFIDPHNLCGSSWPCIPSFPFTLFLCSSSQNSYCSRVIIGCYARCGAALMMGCLSSSSTVSPHHDQVNSEMKLQGRDHANLDTVIVQLSRYAFGGHEIANLEAVIEQVWRCTSRS